MKFLIDLIKRNKSVFFVAGFLGLIGGAVNAQLIAVVSDHIAAFGEEGAAAPIFYVALVSIAFLAGSLTQVFMTFLSARLTYNLRLNMCHQILELPYRKREEIGQSRLMATFTDDIPQITFALLQIPNIFVNLAITLGCLGYLGYLSLPVSGILAAFLVFAMVTYKLPEKFARKYIESTRENWDNLITQFNAILHGGKELTLHNRRREALLNEVLKPTAQALRHSTYSERAIYAFLNNYSRLLYFVFLGLLVYLAPTYLDIELRVLTGFALVVLFIRTPIIILLEAVPTLRRAGIAFGKIVKLGMKPDIQDFANPYANNNAFLNRIEDHAPLETLALKGVTHTFYREREESHFTLGPIDLTVNAGELIFIIGGNGSGKTTLAKLITGLYPPEGGVVELNGCAIDDNNRDMYHQHFTAIFSDFFVFEQFLGMDKESLDKKARDLLEKLQLSHKVAVKDGKLSTTQLSTGQRKRLALVTGYLEDRPIYLFDEWAADQDPEFKEVFYRHLLPELKAKGKTIFIISHDDRYFDVADRFLKLADGNVVETHLRTA